MRRSSGTKPRPRRAISNGFSREISWPQKRHVTLALGDQPMMDFMVVDLPAPLRPISATTSPRPNLERHVIEDVRARHTTHSAPAPSSIALPRHAGAGVARSKVLPVPK